MAIAKKPKTNPLWGKVTRKATKPPIPFSRVKSNNTPMTWNIVVVNQIKRGGSCSNGEWGITNITGLIAEGTNINITGSGTAGDPYVINVFGWGGSTTCENIADCINEQLAEGDFWLITNFEDAVLSIAAPVLGADDNYVTDAQLIVIGNTSGTNTGDNAPNSLYSGLAASKEDTANKSDDVNLGNSSILFPTQNAVKQYVDTVAQGLSPKAAVRVATTTVLPTVTYNNGSAWVGATLTASANGILTLDGVNTVLNDRILVKNQANQAHNGIYVVTTEGTAGIPFVLTRATDMNQASEINAAFTFVTEGTTQADSGRVVTSNWPFTVGTTAITWTQFSGSETFQAGNGLSKSGTTFSINTAVTVDLNTIQTLTNKSISLASNTLSGNIAQFNAALSGDDFATLAGAETLTNKTVNIANNTVTVDGTNLVGYRNIPQNSQSAAYTAVATDAWKHIFHPSADTTARTYTIPANSSVAFPLGTAITFINQNGAGVITIAINTDTMRLAWPGTTGSRTLAANGVATAVKVTSTERIISGTWLT